MGEKKNYKILFVEDEKNLLLLYRKEFEKEHYEILTATSAEEGLKILDENPDIDVVVLDIKMKGMSGLEALAKIARSRKDVGLIIATAYSSFQEDFTSWLADAYIVKSPDFISELKREVKRVLKEKKK